MVYWKAGKKLNNGKYIVNEILGSGGFGVTYKITEAKTNRLFALKTLNIEAQSRPNFAQLQTKFINEAIALASCPHPNIVRVYPQVFQQEGLWCMVMEYIEGEDLGRYIEQNGKFSEADAIAIIRKVGEALSSIHQKGFLHRDIKPANIILRSSDSSPVLIDFGLAREFISEQSMSMTNSRTESFAPIEQYQRHGNFGAWTDVYALAATLYVLLTTRPPLPAKFRHETNYDLTPPKQYESEISDRINEAILKGMEIEPGDRPQSVKKWLELFEEQEIEIYLPPSVPTKYRKEMPSISEIRPQPDKSVTTPDINRSAKQKKLAIRNKFRSTINLARNTLLKCVYLIVRIIGNLTRLNWNNFLVLRAENANNRPLTIWGSFARYTLYGTIVILVLAILLIGLEWSKVSIYPIPRAATYPVLILAGDGETPINSATQNTHHELKKLSDFSSYLDRAVIASEDNNYYWHLGIDWSSIFNPFLNNHKSSTITQQITRSLFPEIGKQNNFRQKIREILIALKLEVFYSKDFILKTYLNRINLGVNLSGFEDAAKFYFDKSAAKINLSEAATLVAMLPDPKLYNPVNDYDTAIGLRNKVIDRMSELGMVGEEEANRARRAPIEVSPNARKSDSMKGIAPYFNSYVLDELQELLGSDLAQEGNFIVETTLNPALQQQAKAALKYSIDNDGDRLDYSQGAVVTLDRKNGNILALVGGVDYEQNQLNRVVQPKRQSGSSFQIFAYAAAIENGISPIKGYSCAPLMWNGQQYRGCERSSGKINMYQGLAQSENVNALRVAQEVGLEKVIDVAQRLGVSSPLIEDPGLVIGQSETTVLEMTGAYATIANDGIWNKPHAINRVLDGSDCKKLSDRNTCREIYFFDDSEKTVFDKSNETLRDVMKQEITDQLTDMLQLAVTEGTGKAAFINQGEAGKTGTTDNNADLWFIGYVRTKDLVTGAKDLVTGIWLGNDDNSPTNGSGEQPASLWGIYMKQAASL